MPLSTQQQEAIPILEWLLSDNPRGTGRTFAQAVALIRLAVRSPGQFISCYDHVNILAAHQNLVDQVKDLIDLDPRLKGNIYWRGSGFRFEARAPIGDWLPDVEIPLPPSVEEHQVESLFDSVTRILAAEPAALEPIERPSRWAFL